MCVCVWFFLQDNEFLPLLNYLLTQSPPKPGSPLTVKVSEESKVSHSEMQCTPKYKLLSS